MVAPEPPTLPRAELSRALLVGSSRFHDDTMHDLPAVARNMTALHTAFTHPEAGVFHPERCAVLHNPGNPRQFIEAVRSTARQAQDLLLIYYAGHGIRHEIRDDLYLGLPDTDPYILDGTAVPVEWIREQFSNSPARTKVLILDCCHSGMALTTGWMSTDTIARRDIDIRGTAVIASAPPNGRSKSPPDARYSVFSGQLIQLLCSGAPGGDPLTVGQLFNSLGSAVAEHHPEHPAPQVSTRNQGGAVLLRRPAAPFTVDEPVQPGYPTSPEYPESPAHQVVIDEPPLVAEPAHFDEPAPPLAATDQPQSNSQLPAVEPMAPLRVAAPPVVWVSTAVGILLRGVLLFSLAVCFGTFVGGAFGESSGGKSTGSQLAASTVFFVLSVVCAALLFLRRWWLVRRFGGPLPLRAHYPNLVYRFTTSVRFRLLLFGTAVVSGWTGVNLLSGQIVGFADDSTAYTDLSLYTVTVALSFELAIVACYGLFRSFWWGRR
ncbi:caspase domain-containing protein [Tamaricihabitans halophyticus]|uniref:Caspase domain-containing protein n=1 Tax=Tamaricihabitans halophyticus TaxID=1262583 RepID=A0A4R2Q6C6_9PSEU|nr:caspase family protein [Tamaricihabitans halophyticus]TCP43398.1 caspase domain-containing protein [Tamaricihabitans halophyticus]